MFAPPRGGGHYFWCGSRLRRRWRQRSLFEELHLRNLWVDSDQTCMVTSPWWRKAVFRFWWPWPHLQGHSPQTVNFGPKWRICSLSMKFGHSQEGALIYLKTFFLSSSLAFSDSYSSQRRTDKTFFRFGRIRFHPATELCPPEGSTLSFSCHISQALASTDYPTEITSRLGYRPP